MTNPTPIRPVRRIGLTTRITSANGYEEPRDSLAQNWAGFMSAALPEAGWMAIPNTGGSILKFLESWQLEALILTGGDDIGQTPLRDDTERTLLGHFIERGMPVFGVCRGMQLIQTEFGGELTPCTPDDHVATRHTVTFNQDLGLPDPGTTEASVNSFHTSAINSASLADGLTPLAVTNDGYVEAFRASNTPLIGVMWHPEREAIISELDCRLLRPLFGYPVDAPNPDQ